MSETRDENNWAQENYERQVSRIAGQLRRLADDWERGAKPRAKPGVMGCPRFTNAAENALHELTWGLANIGAYRIVSAAGEADEAERGSCDS